MHDELRTRIGTALAAGALLLQGCGPAKSGSTAAPVPQVSTVTVQRQSVPITVELPGRTAAYLVAQVRARVDGIVQQRSFTEGSFVRAGQRLYQIDPAPFIAALNSATASLHKAEANLASTTVYAERLKLLLASSAVSQQDFDNALAARAQAAADVMTGQAAVATARINLDYTTVVSPISGRTGVSAVTQGAFVQASAATLMTTTQQIDPIYVDVTQASVAGLQLRRDIAGGRLKKDGAARTKVLLLLEDGTTYPLPGKLEFSDITVDQGTGSVTLRTVFPNPQAVLLPGMFVRARIEAGVVENAFLVPQVGVTRDPQGQASALVVGADDKVAARALTVRGTQGDAWIVDSGLAAGERVIVAGLQKVRPGAAVQVMPAKAATVVSRNN
jgi:membrane fusion protein (multidrug efflux system)